MNWITCGNALRLDWLSICPPTGSNVKFAADDLFHTPLDQAQVDFENEGEETYVCGNPPYFGSRKQELTQKEDLKALCSKTIHNWKSLDYVAGWMLLATQYMERARAEVAFVTTSSMCEGLQASILWPHILTAGTEIKFAHSPFSWSNLASNNAGVTVVIVGITKARQAKKLLFALDGLVRSVDNISPYLIPGRTVYVESASQPISGLPRMVMGSMPRDGGHLLTTAEEARTLKAKYPDVKHLFRRYMGSEDLIRGLQRTCIWVEDADLETAQCIPELQERFAAVRESRAASTLKSTREFAQCPHRFVYLAGKAQLRTVAVPRVSSARRPFLPVDVLEPDCVPSDAVCALYDAPVWSVALIASRIHICWVGAVCGKLKTDFRYSNTLGWNTFPVPTLTEQNKADLTRCAQDILLAREAHFPATIADLYDPENMPENLIYAHERNDEVLERIYIGRRVRNDTERLEKLFDLYTKMASTRHAVKPKGKTAQ
jgi:hypothetical protein